MAIHAEAGELSHHNRDVSDLQLWHFLASFCETLVSAGQHIALSGSSTSARSRSFAYERSQLELLIGPQNK